MISLKDQAGVTSTNKYLFASTQSQMVTPKGHKTSNVVNSKVYSRPQNLDTGPAYHLKRMTATEDERTLMFVVNSIGGYVAPGLLTATKFRHRASILFKSMTATEDERTFMFAHLGHSEKVNQNVYQHPQAISEVIHVEKFLQQFDGKNWVPICLWSSI